MRIAVTKIESEKDKEISELLATLKTEKAEKQLEIDKITSVKDKQLAEKELEISRLKGELELNKTSTDLAVKNAVQAYYYLPRFLRQLSRTYIPISSAVPPIKTPYIADTGTCLPKK